MLNPQSFPLEPMSSVRHRANSLNNNKEDKDEDKDKNKAKGTAKDKDKNSPKYKNQINNNGQNNTDKNDGAEIGAEASNRTEVAASVPRDKNLPADTSIAYVGSSGALDDRGNAKTNEQMEHKLPKDSEDIDSSTINNTGSGNLQPSNINNLHYGTTNNYPTNGSNHSHSNNSKYYPVNQRLRHQSVTFDQFTQPFYHPLQNVYTQPQTYLHNQLNNTNTPFTTTSNGVNSGTTTNVTTTATDKYNNANNNLSQSSYGPLNSPYNFLSVYPSQLPNASFSSLPRLNSIVEDSMLYTFNSRRNSVLLSSDISTGNTPIDLNVYPSNPTENPLNTASITPINANNNSTSNNSYTSTDITTASTTNNLISNLPVVSNPVSFSYGSSFCPRFSFDQGNYIGLADPSISSEFSKEYVPGSNMNVSNHFPQNFSMNQIHGQVQAARLSSQSNNSAATCPTTTVNSNTNSSNANSNHNNSSLANNFGFAQPYIKPNANDHLISTRRQSEQLDPFVAQTLFKSKQPKSVSTSSNNRSSVMSNMHSTGSIAMIGNSNSSSTSNINSPQSNVQPISVISQPNGGNSRQSSFFIRKFPSSFYLPNEFTISEIDSFLKRDNGTPDILDPLQVSNNNNNANTNATPNIHGGDTSKPGLLTRSRNSFMYNLPFPSNLNHSNSFSQIVGAISGGLVTARESISNISQQLNNNNISELIDMEHNKSENPANRNTDQSMANQSQNKQQVQYLAQHQINPKLLPQQPGYPQQYQITESQSKSRDTSPELRTNSDALIKNDFASPSDKKYALKSKNQSDAAPAVKGRSKDESKLEQNLMVMSKQKTKQLNASQKSAASKRSIISKTLGPSKIAKKSRRKCNDENIEMVKENLVKTEAKNSAADNVERDRTRTTEGLETSNGIKRQKRIITKKLNENDEKKLIDSNLSLKRDDGRPLIGATKVDQLMLIIQARQKGVCGNIEKTDDGSILKKSDGIDNNENVGGVLPNPIELIGGVEKTATKGNKNYQCKYCRKKFTQSTHLDVHLRSHMGVKPYKCDYCDKRFTQGGNLRTHMRLHTGEKPFQCEICQKTFSRKGNLQAHLLTHDSYKPYVCKFDGCNKGFTQLGNLKAHQNRFHLDTINELFNKLAQFDKSQESFQSLPKHERELLDYFSSLYKNLNKGIKGRGRDKS